jgi:hypothetical protein
VIKNQCSNSSEFVVHGYSEHLQGDYWGRYPAVVEQEARIRRYFEQVQVLRYPENFNKWENSSHLAFVASGPRL